MRHNPDAAGVALDDSGWVDVDALIKGAARNGMLFSRVELAQVVVNSDKKRFTLSEGQNRIRAAQGHSVQVDLGLLHVAPPEVLYHGTASRNVDAIFSKGLIPQSRQHVHLSHDVETATKVGARHGKPVVLRVNASKAARNGQRFYQAENGVWLTDTLSPDYLAKLGNE